MTTTQMTASTDVDSIVNLLKAVDLTPSDPYIFVDTSELVSDVIDAIEDLPANPPSLFLDLEGENLSRDGNISILQLFVSPLDRTYLLDVYALKDSVFTTKGTSGTTLQDILQSTTVSKVFFDVRNDSDALYHHYRISLRGVQDLQLMDLATRVGSRKFVNGLAKCIESSYILSRTERESWKKDKENGLKLFAPERGGSYAVFNERPLSKEIKLYCVQDVRFLPRLWAHYNRTMSDRWRLKVRQESAHRVLLSQSPGYQPHGRQKALAPTAW